MCYAFDKSMRWLVLAAACVLGGCTSKAPATGNDADPPVANCTFIDASACQQPVPSYANDVAPVLDRACNSTCHAPGVGPWPLNNYSDVFDWGSIIAGDVELCTMPPPDAGAGNGDLSDQERAMILDWLACGGPNN